MAMPEPTIGEILFRRNQTSTSPDATCSSLTTSPTPVSPCPGSWRTSAPAAPLQCEVFSLLRKPELVKVEVPLRYLGFDIPPDFGAGYGMDYAQRYRNLPYIARLHF